MEEARFFIFFSLETIIFLDNYLIIIEMKHPKFGADRFRFRYIVFNAYVGCIGYQIVGVTQLQPFIYIFSNIISY